MGATGQTPNLQLPQFEQTDKPSWMGDINGAFLTVDTFAGTTDGKIQTAQNTANAAKAAADAASSSVQEVQTDVDTKIAGLQTTVSDHTSSITSLQQTQQTHTTQIAAAQQTAQNAQQTASAAQGQASTNANSISALQTTQQNQASTIQTIQGSISSINQTQQTQGGQITTLQGQVATNTSAIQQLQNNQKTGVLFIDIAVPTYMAAASPPVALTAVPNWYARIEQEVQFPGVANPKTSVHIPSNPVRLSDYDTPISPYSYSPGTIRDGSSPTPCYLFLRISGINLVNYAALDFGTGESASGNIYQVGNVWFKDATQLFPIYACPLQRGNKISTLLISSINIWANSAQGVIAPIDINFVTASTRSVYATITNKYLA